MDSGRLIFDPSCHGNMLFLGNADPILRGSRYVLNMEESSRRRPFFTSPEELFDDEYYDEQTPEKKRRLSPEQVHMLEKSFEADNKLEPERKSDLAKKLGLQQRQVAVWFQNRRARWKTKQLERDYDQLKSSYDSLLSDYDSILKDNQKLKAEVLSLAEKVNVKEMTEPPLLGKKSDSLVVDTEQVDTEQVPSLQSIVKVEDRLSTGSGRSIVVDEDGPHLVDSGDSYFPENEYPGCVSPMDVVHSSEDDGTDNTHNYFPDVFVAAQQENHHAADEEPTGWWVWA